MGSLGVEPSPLTLDEKATLVNLHENLATGWACRVTCVELLNKIGVVEKNTGLILVIYLGLVRIGLVG